MIGYTNFGPATHGRSANPVVAEGNSVIAPEYRGRGFSRILLGLLAWGVWVIGYKGLQMEWSMDNVASGRVCMEGTVPNGILPRSIFYRDVGWVDSCLAYQDTGVFVNRHEIMQALRDTGIDTTKAKL